MRAHTLIALALAVSLSARAEVVPRGGSFDARVKEVTYNRSDVVRVVGHYGYSTNIEFSSGEEIQSIAVGDTVAWEVAPVGNHLFVKPREKNAATNMTVVTSRYTYEFELDAKNVGEKTGGWDHTMFFQVRFHYPDDDIAARKLALDTKRREENEARVKALLDAPPQPSNWNYWGCGELTIRPTEAYDDGRFTYLRFPFAQELPAVFAINADGTESLVNGGMHGDQYVVQQTARKFVLRKGASVACVENRSYNPWGVPTPNSTTNPKLSRKVKENAVTIEDLPAAPSVVPTAATNGQGSQQSPVAQPAPVLPPFAAPTVAPPSPPPAQAPVALTPMPGSKGN